MNVLSREDKKLLGPTIEVPKDWSWTFRPKQFKERAEWPRAHDPEKHALHARRQRPNAETTDHVQDAVR
jgi:hypothetical protein